MVGLSIVLEAPNPKGGSVNEKIPQVINKTTMAIKKPTSPSFSSTSSSSLRNLSQSSFSSPTFLNECFLCKQKLLQGKDIYMYRGDRAFCSVECRCRQILMDEEESFRKENCSFEAIKPTSASSSSGSRQHRKGNKNRTGGFAY